MNTFFAITRVWRAQKGLKRTRAFIERWELGTGNGTCAYTANIDEQNTEVVNFGFYFEKDNCLTMTLEDDMKFNTLVDGSLEDT